MGAVIGGTVGGIEAALKGLPFLPERVTPPPAGTAGPHVEFGTLEGEMPAWEHPVTGEPMPAKPFRINPPTNPNRIALGVYERLDNFADDIGGTTWETWAAGDFETQFMETITNPTNEIHFNLTGQDGKMLNVWQAVSEGARGFSKSPFVTSWELFQIYSNPSVLSRTTFYFNGAIIPNPF